MVITVTSCCGIGVAGPITGRLQKRRSEDLMCETSRSLQQTRMMCGLSALTTLPAPGFRLSRTPIIDQLATALSIRLRIG
jgi:hypothetical protein